VGVSACWALRHGCPRAKRTTSTGPQMDNTTQRTRLSTADADKRIQHTRSRSF